MTIIELIMTGASVYGLWKMKNQPAASGQGTIVVPPPAQPDAVGASPLVPTISGGGGNNLNSPVMDGGYTQEQLAAMSYGTDIRAVPVAGPVSGPTLIIDPGMTLPGDAVYAYNVLNTASAKQDMWVSPTQGRFIVTTVTDLNGHVSKRVERDITQPSTGTWITGGPTGDHPFLLMM